MPTISRFFGITIYMFHRDHVPPHIHAWKGGSRSVFTIKDGRRTEGKLSKGDEKLVAAWIEIHRRELLEDWKLARAKKNLFEIDPLG